MLPLSLIYTFILGVFLALAHALICTLLPRKNDDDLGKQVNLHFYILPAARAAFQACTYESSRPELRARSLN